MDIVISILSLLGFIALTAGTALFVAGEFSLTALERATIDDHVASKDDAAARSVAKAHSSLSLQLSSAQLGITITTLATGFLAEPVLAQYITPLLDATGLPDSWVTPTALVIALIVATSLSMVYGELVPKNLAITSPLPVARWVARPLMTFTTIFGWLIRGLNSSANWLVRRFGIEPADELASARSPQELAALVRNSSKHGSITEAKAELLDRSLSFGELTAEEVMTPRSTIISLDCTDTVTDLLTVALESGHSRFPVVNRDLDEPVGVIHVKDAFAVPASERSHTQLQTLVRTPLILPSTLDADAVLDRVRRHGSQVALIADEYGGTAGLVTTEDLVEEILGSVVDEHDNEAQETDYVYSANGWDCSGLLRPDELSRVAGYFAPEGAWETLGGLMMATLGRIPRPGDRMLLPETTTDALDEFVSGLPGRWLATVAVMDGRRIDRAVLKPISQEAATRMLLGSTPSTVANGAILEPLSESALAALDTPSTTALEQAGDA